MIVAKDFWNRYAPKERATIYRWCRTNSIGLKINNPPTDLSIIEEDLAILFLLRWSK